MMEETRAFLRKLGLPDGDAHQLPTSAKRFPDGAHYRVEIPSVEGPAVLKAVLEEAQRHGVRINRVSQGSGILLLTDEEIREMARLGRDAQIEVSLFVGPRAAWDPSATVLSPAGKALAARVRGMESLVYAVEDVRRACALGIRGVLVADSGLLWVLHEMKVARDLPIDLVIKISVQMAAANPASIRLVEELGAGTYNVPTDLTAAQIAAVRQAVDMPLDIYFEAPDDLGGFIRHYETPELVRVAAPVYCKYGLRNAPNIYPSGSHLEATAVALGKERVRRAALGLRVLRQYMPDAVQSDVATPDLGVPV